MNYEALIAKYFDKTLTEEEKVLFREKYTNDRLFKEEVDRQANIILVLKSLAAQEQIAEEKMNPVVPLYKKQANKKVLWYVLSGAAAAVLVLLILVYSFHQTITRQQQMIVKMQEGDKMLTALQDTVTEQKAAIALLSDSLSRRAKIVVNTSTGNAVNYDLVAGILKDMTIQDFATKGAAMPTLRFTAPKRDTPCAYDYLKIEWTPLNKIADIEVYFLNQYGDKEAVLEYRRKDYNLNTGHFVLKQLKKSTLYYFEIRTESKRYSYPFLTQH